MEPRPDVHGLRADTPRAAHDPDHDARAALIYGLISVGIPASILLSGSFDPVSRLFEGVARILAINEVIAWFVVVVVSGVAAIGVGRRARRGGSNLRRAGVAVTLGTLGILAGIVGAALFALLAIAMRNFQF